MSNYSIVLELDDVTRALQDRYDTAQADFNSAEDTTSAAICKARRDELMFVARELGVSIDTRPPDQRE